MSAGFCSWFTKRVYHLYFVCDRPAVNVGCYISKKVEVRGLTAFEIDPCQANEFSSVKSEVL